MNSQCIHNLAEIQIKEPQVQSLIDAYDQGYESSGRDQCPYAQGTLLSVNWHLGYEHAECEGRFK